MPVIRKKIRKVDCQGEFESKRKWQRVTEALLRDDVEAASAAKHEVYPSVSRMCVCVCVCMCVCVCVHINITQ